MIKLHCAVEPHAKTTLILISFIHFHSWLEQYFACKFRGHTIILNSRITRYDDLTLIGLENFHTFYSGISLRNFNMIRLQGCFFFPTSIKPEKMNKHFSSIMKIIIFIIFHFKIPFDIIS